MKGNKFLIKLGDFIVNFRYLFLAIFIVLLIICGYNINNVDVNYDITSYLPGETETKNGLELMEKEFGELNEMQLMITNIFYENALTKAEEIKELDHVQSVSFNETEDYYKDKSALIVVELDDVDDETRTNVKEEIQNIVSDSEYYLYVENDSSPVNGMTTILAIIVVVIILVLLLTSRSYFDLVLAGIVFGASILLNMGSNFLLGEISYVTKSIAVVLQLGLSLDYLIIFLNHYIQEIEDTDNVHLAVKKTVSKSIPEVFASSLTTVSGLMALVFMQLRIGGDIGIVMSKGIICSMLTVILLLPCLLIIFNKAILKLKHRSFIPDVTKLSKIIASGRKVLLPLFIIVTVVAIFMMNKYQYVYNIYSVKSHTASNEQIALEKIEDTFGTNNRLVVLVKNTDKNYQEELDIANALLEDKNIVSVTSIGSIKIDENLYLGTKINYQEFASIFGLELQNSAGLYQMYAQSNDELEKLGDMDNYRITIIDWINFLYEHQEEVPLDEEMSAKINNYYDKIQNSIGLLESDNYSRFIIEYKGNKESDETFELLDSIRDKASESYDEVTLVGESVSARDLKSTFSDDNLKINLITIAFIVIILLFTFKSIGMTLLLVLTIEGSILINFGIAALTNQNIFFMSYIIVSAIQMGATIDYAIVMSSRYQFLRKKMNRQEAMVGALKDSLPAVITSGFILTIAGFLIGYISDSGVIASIGMFLGIGTLISMICTIFILPSILYACDKFIQITTFKK